MPADFRAEQLLVEELMSRTQVILGRIAALRDQISALDSDLIEIEGGTSELLHRLAKAQHELGTRAARQL